MQKQIFIGNLTKDVEVKTVGNDEKQSTVAILSLACNDTNNKDKEPVFVSVEVWGKSAEVCAKYLAKGKKVYVETEMRNNNYEKDGVKVYGYKFVAHTETIEFLSPAPVTAPDVVPKPTPEPAKADTKKTTKRANKDK